MPEFNASKEMFAFEKWQSETSLFTISTNSADILPTVRQDAGAGSSKKAGTTLMDFQNTTCWRRWSTLIDIRCTPQLGELDKLRERIEYHSRPDVGDPISVKAPDNWAKYQNSRVASTTNSVRNWVGRLLAAVGKSVIWLYDRSLANTVSNETLPRALTSQEETELMRRGRVQWQRACCMTCPWEIR